MDWSTTFLPCQLRDADDVLALPLRGRYIYVNPFGRNRVAILIKKLVGHDDNLVGAAVGVDDAMLRAERSMIAANLINGRCYLVPVVGMLVGEHQFGGGRDRPRHVPVEALNLRRPFPRVSFKPEAE